MAENFDPTFISLTDEEGNEFVLEYVSTLEYEGQQYMAFFPAEVEGEESEEDEEGGVIILKVVHEDGEDNLCTIDSEEELNAVYEKFMEELFEDEE